MTRSFCLILCAAGLLAAGCAKSDAGARLADAHVLALEARLDSITTQNAQLEEEARLNHAFLKEYTTLINRTLAHLDVITEREGMLRRIRLDIEAGEAGSWREGQGTIQQRLNDNLVAIERYIEESERQREELRRQHAELQRIARVPSVDNSGLTRTIERLNLLVEEQEKTILSLREEARRLQGRIAELKEANTELVEENTELRQAFYVVGTREELLQRGIIDRRGGFLSIGRRTHIDELDPRHFQAATVETREVFVGEHLKRYQILSHHRNSASLYAFERRGAAVYLAIHDAEAFWKISRYLVVEVKR